MRHTATARYALTILALGGTPLGCVGDPPAPDKAEPRLRGTVLPKPPAKMDRSLAIDYEGKVTLLGCDVAPKGMVKPGSRVTLTLYWQARTKLEEGWGLFTHVLDPSGARVLNLDNVGPLREWQGSRQILGPWAWTPGNVYVDEQSFVIPAQVKASSLTVVTGLWKGDRRLRVVAGPRDREQRGIVTVLTLDSPARVVQDTRVPRLRVDELPRAPDLRLDGKLDEAAWGDAANTGPFRDVATGLEDREAKLGATAKLMWDKSFLYVGVTVTDVTVSGGFDPRQVDPKLWTRDTVELMIDPDGDGDNRDYYEIQINPQNLVFDSQFDDYNLPRGGPDGPFGHQDWSSGVESGVSLDGTIDNHRDRDRGYVVEARIPWRVFGRARRAPPTPGDEWRVNVYAMEDNGGVAWSPILRQGNFHRASRFGRVLWAREGLALPESLPGRKP